MASFWHKGQLSLFLTTQCDLRCTYCYMPKREVKAEHRFLRLEYARAGIRFLAENYNSKAIRFFGAGEPTLAFGLMKDIWQEALATLGPDASMEIETNGHFGGGIAAWIEENADVVWISCDGPPSVQDINRPTAMGGASSPIVEANIRRLSRRTGLQVGVRITTRDPSAQHQERLLRYFAELGVLHIAISPVYYSYVNPECQPVSLMEFAKGFVPAFEAARRLGVSYQTLMTVNFDEDVDVYCQACIPFPRVTTDGYLSCCDWASLGPEYLQGELEQCLFGRYDDAQGRFIVDVSRRDWIRTRDAKHLGEGACAGCPAMRRCVGGCLGKMLAATGDMHSATDDWCSATRFLFRELPVGKIELAPVLHP